MPLQSLHINDTLVAYVMVVGVREYGKFPDLKILWKSLTGTPTGIGKVRWILGGMELKDPYQKVLYRSRNFPRETVYSVVLKEASLKELEYEDLPPLLGLSDKLNEMISKELKDYA